MLSGAFELDAVDREDVIADRDVDAGRGQRRAQLGIPALGVVDLRDLVPAAVDREVRAEQAADGRRHLGHVAAAHVRVTDRDLGAHVVEQVVQIGAMIHVRQELAVHLLHLRPVGAVRVRHVEVVALVAPALVEDLLELFLRLEIHPQRRVEASLAGLRRMRSASTRNRLTPAPRRPRRPAVRVRHRRRRCDRAACSRRR